MSIGTCMRQRGSWTRIALACWVFSFSVYVAAFAGTVTLGGHTLVINLPSGYCELDPNQPRDAALLARQTQTPGAKPISQFTECTKLVDFRAGRIDTLEHGTIAIQTYPDGSVVTAGAMTRETYLDQIVKSLPSLDLAGSTKAAIEKTEKRLTIDVGTPKVLRRDEDAVYVLAKMKVTRKSDQETGTAITITATTIINRIPLSFSFVRRDSDDVNLDQWEKKTSDLVHAIILANEPVAGPKPPSGACQEPAYPLESEIAGEEGVVSLSFLIGTDGVVIKGKVQRSSGFPRLDDAALNALVKCRFKPKMVDGKPVQDWNAINYRWQIE